MKRDNKMICLRTMNPFLCLVLALFILSGSTSISYATPAFIVSPNIVPVPEGGTQTVKVWLSEEPAANVTATVTWSSGDPDIYLDAGGAMDYSIEIPKSAWSTPVSIIVSATEDTDKIWGKATIRIQDTTTGIAIDYKEFTAIEKDNDGVIEVGGTLANNTVWNDTTQAYRLTSQLTIPATYTLKIEQGVIVEQNSSSYHGFVVDGTLEAKKNSILLLKTFAMYSNNYRNGIILQNGGCGQFTDCTILAQEASDRWNQGTNEWGALFRVDSLSRISLAGCALESLNTINDYRTGYGVLLSGGQAAIQANKGVSPSIRGFRWGIYQVFGSSSQVIAPCNSENCSANHCISGTVVRNTQLRNTGMRAVGNVTVQSGATLTLAVGSDLYQAYPYETIVDGGSLIATDAAYSAEIYTYPRSNPDHRDGITFKNGGTGAFTGCQLEAKELRDVNDFSQWAALLYADSNSNLTLEGCTLKRHESSSGRPGFGVYINGATATLKDEGSTPNSFDGFYNGLYQVFSSAPQEIDPCNFSNCTYDYFISGDVIRDITLTNTGMKVYGTVTVKPEGKLVQAPGSNLYVWKDHWLIVDGGTYVGNEATLETETYTYPRYSADHRDGMYLQNGGTGIFKGCQFYADEIRDSPDSSQWSALIYADGTSNLKTQGCSFESRNVSGLRTGYAMYINGATATLVDDGTASNSIKGFRGGMYLGFGQGEWDIDKFDYDSTDYETAVVGTVSKNYNLGPNYNYMFGNVTIESGAELLIPPQGTIHTRGYTLTVNSGGTLLLDEAIALLERPIKAYGTVSAEDTHFWVYTYAYPNVDNRRNGFDCYDGSEMDFNRCSFYTGESRTTGNSGDWAAVFFLGANTSFTANECFFKTRSQVGYESCKTCYIIRSWCQKKLHLTGCSFMDNHYALRLDAFPTNALVQNNDFSGNYYAIYNASGQTLSAKQNWWGDDSGPTHVENPGGTGDRVSDYVDYGQSSLEPNTDKITLLDPATGQESSNLTTDANQTDVELIGFQVDPGQSEITSIYFHVYNMSGITWDQFSNFRLVFDSNGNGDADASEIASATSATSLEALWSNPTHYFARFSNALYTAANPSLGYILIADLANLESGDAFSVEVYSDLLRATEGQPVETEVHSVRHVFQTSVSLANLIGGQVGDNLNGYSRQNNVVLFGFRMQGDDELVDSVKFDLSGISGMIRSTITTSAIYLDMAGDGKLDAADSRLGYATEIEISGTAGHISFDADLAMDAAYLLVTSFRSLASGAQITVGLSADNISMVTDTTVLGYADTVTHAMDTPYMLAENENWQRPSHFGQTVDQDDFPFLGIRILPLGRTVNSLKVQLSSIVGIEPGEISDAQLYWDKDDNGVLDGSDELYATGTISITKQEGEIEFNTDFPSRGSLIISVDFTSLANGDEITVDMTSSDLEVPEGYTVTGAVPAIRYYAQTGMPDNSSKNMNWTLTYRSPGGKTVMGRYNNKGDKIILGYNTGSAWIYDSTTNTPILMLKDHYDKVEYAGFSSDDSAAITVTRDGAVYIWDATTGSQRSAMFSDLLVTYAVPSSNLSKLMVITEGKGIMLDIDNEERLWEYVPGNATVNAIAYSPDDKYVLIGSSDKRAYLIDAETGLEIRRYAGHQQQVTAVSFTGDGSHMMTSSTDAVVNYWKTDQELSPGFGGPPLSSISLGQESQGAATSPDGTRVAIVTGSGTNAQLRMYDPTVGITMLELYAINIYDKCGGRWGGSLETLAFDSAGERILVTSRDSDWARVASFRVDNGDYILNWGPQGRLNGGNDARVRISQDGQRIFVMGDWGLNVLFPTPGKTLLTEANLPGNKGFDITDDGSRVAWFTSDGNLHIDNVAEEGFTQYLNRSLGETYNNYNAITYSDSGDMIIAGDRLLNGRTGELLADAADSSRNARGDFSPDGKYWGYVVPGSQTIRTMLLQYNDPENPNVPFFVTTLTDTPMSLTPNRMFYHNDGERVACVDMGVGVQMYNLFTDLPVGLYRFSNMTDVAISKDGTLMLLAGENEVHLREVKTGRTLRYFYPQHSGLGNMVVYSVQFAQDDNLIMIAWSENYIETYERSQAKALRITPSSRVLAEGESQTYEVTVIYDNDSVANVTPSSATNATDRATLEIIPPEMAEVDTNIVSVVEGATGSFIIRARYREGGTSFIADATVTVGMSHLIDLIASPATLNLVPGVFREISYTAVYDDGYQIDVTPLVDLSTDYPDDIVIAGQSIKINMTAPPGVYVVTGTYENGHGDSVSADTTIESFGLKTQWERYRVTSGGGGLSGDWKPDGTQMAWGSSSGAVNIYTVGSSPSNYTLDKVILAHGSSVVFVDYLDNDSLVTASKDGSIKVWNLVNSVTQPVSIYYHDAPILCAARSGAKVAFGDNVGKVGVYDYSLDDLDWVLPFHESSVKSMAVDTDYVLSGGEDRRAKVLQRSDGTLVRNIYSHEGPIVSVGFIGTNSFFTASSDQTLCFWRRSDFDILNRYEYPVVPTHAEVINNQLYMATTGPNATWVYNSDGLLLRWLDHPPQKGAITKFLISPGDGKYILTGRSTIMQEEKEGGLWGDLGGTEMKPSTFSSFQFWEVGRGIFRGSLAHSFPLTDAHPSADANRIFTQNDKRTIKWTFGDIDSATVSEQRLMETGYFVNYEFQGMDFTADDGILGTRVERSVYLYDTMNDLLWKTVHMPGGSGPFALSPSGNLMAFSDNYTRLWDIRGAPTQIAMESRVSSTLDFRLEDDFLGGGSDTIGVWHAVGESAGLMYNLMDTEYQPTRLFVNSTGTRCVAVTYYEECDLLGDCIYYYYLEIFDISELTIEPPKIGQPIFLFSSDEQVFAGGQSSYLAVTDDTGLVLVGADGDRPAKLITTADGKVIREFYAPSGQGETNVGSAAVGFADNDRSLMIAWKEGFAEYYRRIPPWRLSVVVTKTSLVKDAEGKPIVLFKKVINGEGDIYVSPGDVLNTETLAFYTNGSNLNVTSTASLVSDNTAVATIDGRYIYIDDEAEEGQEATITATYDELGNQLQATVNLIVGRLQGDTSDDSQLNYLDLFEFSRHWKEAADQSNTLCNEVEDSVIDEKDLLGLIKYWK